jgi:hypothetical protein
LQELKLDHVAMVFARDEHEFREQLPRVRRLAPLLVNCHAVLAACMQAAIRASHHIHARVGWSHGPQVADPTRGAGLVWTELFEGWWDRIIVNCMAERREFLTINPEFGPPPYAPADR